MNLTDMILVEGFAGIIEAIMRLNPDNAGKFTEAAERFRRTIDDMDAGIKAAKYQRLVANHGVPEPER
jgi:hypothetical protein